MSKTPSDSLSKLIQALTRAEKRYIKLHLLNHAGSKSQGLVELMDAVNDQRVYSEKKLNHIKHLPVKKGRLEHAIYEALDEYHSQKSVTARIRSGIRSIEILYEKGLIDHASRLLERTKKLAVKYEDHLSQFELINWRLKIAHVQGYTSISAQGLEDLHDEAIRCLELMINMKKYARYSDRVYLHIRKGGFFRDRKEFEKALTFMNDPDLSSDNKALSTEAKYYFYSAKIGYLEVQARYPEAYEMNKKILDIFNSSPAIIEKSPRLYLAMFQNMMVWQYQMKKYEEARVAAENVKAFAISKRHMLSESLISRTVYYSNTMILLCGNRMGEFKASMDKIPEFKRELKTYHIRPYSKEVEWMYYDAAAMSCFGAGNFSDSLYYENLIIYSETGNLRTDMQSMVRVFTLLIHYEMGNQDLLRYMVKWIYRYLVKNELLNKFEEFILKFIRTKIQHLDTKKKQIIAFSELKTELESLLSDTYQRRPLDDFEFIEWLESKITGIPFAEVVRRKYEAEKV